MAKPKEVSVIVARAIYVAGELVESSDKPITLPESIAIQLVDQGKCRWPDAQATPAKKKATQADV